MIDRNLIAALDGIKLSPKPRARNKAAFRSYRPQHDRRAVHVIMVLKAWFPTGRVSTAELARLADIPPHQLRNAMTLAIDAGLVVFTLVHGRRGVWSLPTKE